MIVGVVLAVLKIGWNSKVGKSYETYVQNMPGRNPLPKQQKDYFTFQISYSQCLILSLWSISAHFQGNIRNGVRESNIIHIAYWGLQNE